MSVVVASLADMGHHHRAQGMGMVELAPSRCPAGHRLGAEEVLIGTQPCMCAGIPHRTWQCVRCQVVQVWPPCEYHPLWVVWEGEP